MNFDATQFHFIRPLFLLLFILLAWFVWRTYQYSQKSNSWNNACDPGLLSYLLVGVEKKKGWFHLLLLFLVGALLIMAMAGPTWSKLPQAVYKKETARVFVLDLSRSMDSTDLAPDRASRAKLKLIDFLTESKEGLSALVVYANNPHIVSPLTDDSNTIISMVPSLSTAIMPSSGGRADKAIMKAAQLLTQAGNTEGDIVLLTDGVDLAMTSDVAEKISAAGYTLNVIGIGTEQGAPIPNGGNGFLKDSQGGIVIPKLNRSDLKSLALAGSGVYSDLTIDNRDIQRVKKMDLGQNLQKNNPLVREVDLWRDQGHLFLLLALPFAALGFRRGWLGTVALATLVTFAMPQQNAYAIGWDELWINKNQQAEKALIASDAEKAATLFENDEWKGVAEYKSGNYEKAEAQFLKSDTADSYYNLGNALAQQGKFPEAIEAYNNTLERNPNHKDAQHNKELVEKIKGSQKSDEQNQDGEDGENGDKEDSQDQKNKDQESQDQESKDGDEQKDNEQSDTEKSESDEQSEKEKQDAERKAEEEREKQENEQKEESAEQQSDEQMEQKEIEQATEQWLRRIPDDPGGLLREKMRRQNLRDRGRSRENMENQW